MSNPIRLVAVDLDHTILRSDGTLSNFTAEVFRRLRRCQTRVCVLTARRRASAEAICAQLDCRGAAFYNGALVEADGGVIALHPMSGPSVQALLPAVGQLPCSVSCTDHTVYTNYRTQHSTQLTSWSQLPAQDVLRLVLYKAQPDLMERLTAAACTRLCVQRLGHGDIVVTAQPATKEQALTTLLEYWNLSPDETAAFGDDGNDLGFLTLAGTGIAVQNAERELKERADAVCGSNDEDGPALWLNQYVLRPLGAEVI